MEYKKALDALDIITHIDKDLIGNFWHLKGLCLYKLQKTEECFDCFNEAKKHDGVDLSIWVDIAQLLYESNNKKQSFAIINELLSKNKNLSISEKIQLARFLCLVERYEDSQELLESILNNDPDHLEANLLLLMILNMRGDYCKSVNLSEKLIDSGQLDLRIFRERCVAIRRQGKHKQAILGLRLLLNNAPSNFEILHALHECLIDKCRMFEAAAIKNKIAEINPDLLVEAFPTSFEKWLYFNILVPLSLAYFKIRQNISVILVMQFPCLLDRYNKIILGVIK